MLGILLCFPAFLLTSPPHLCTHLVLCGKEKVKDLGRQGRCFIGQNLARPHHSASSACLIHWLEMAPLGPRKFTLSDFYRAVYGLRRGKAGYLLSGAALSNEPYSWCSFSSFPLCVL